MESAGKVSLSLSMAIGFSDCVDYTLLDVWRTRLLDAERRFTQNQNDESRMAYLRVLKIFTDLVLHGILPSEKPGNPA
jgi:hypothetical protein